MFTSSPAYLTNTIKSLTLQLLLTESIDFNQKRFQKPPLDHRLYKQLHSEHERDTAPEQALSFNNSTVLLNCLGKAKHTKPETNPTEWTPNSKRIWLWNAEQYPTKFVLLLTNCGVRSCEAIMHYRTNGTAYESQTSGEADPESLP